VSSSVFLPMLKQSAFSTAIYGYGSDETPGDHFTVLESTLALDDYAALKTMLVRLKRLCVRQAGASAYIHDGMALDKLRATSGQITIPMPDASVVIFDFYCSTMCKLTLFVSNGDFEVELPLFECHGTDLSDKVKAETPHYHNLSGELCDMKTMYNFLENYFANIIVNPFSDEEVVCELMEFLYDYSNMEQLEK